MGKHRTLDDLRDRAVGLLRHALDSEGQERIASYMAVAGIIVDARNLFHLADGTPDLQGRTWDYKQWAREVYTFAGVSSQNRSKVQANIGYHVSSIVRERYSPDEVESSGLSVRSLRERRTDRRHQDSHVLDLFLGAGPMEDIDDQIDAFNLMQYSVARMPATPTTDRVTRSLSAALKALESEADSQGQG